TPPAIRRGAGEGPPVRGARPVWQGAGGRRRVVRRLARTNSIKSVGNMDLSVPAWLPRVPDECDRREGSAMALWEPDPTFYPSPRDAAEGPAERLAYVAAFDRAARRPDAIAGLDTDPGSADYGSVVGWTD